MLMVHTDDELVRAFDWSIVAFCLVGEMASQETDLPALIAACWINVDVITVFLCEHKSYPSLSPVCHQCSISIGLESCQSVLDIFD